MRCWANLRGKKNEAENLRDAVGYRLDYPQINCGACEEIQNRDGIEPDCDGCDLPLLLPQNQEAWELYGILNTRFVQDFQALGLVFEVYSRPTTKAGAKALLEKLTLIHHMVTDDAEEKRSLSGD